MPGRTYTAGSGYRYGFNGKENDNDVKGNGNQQDFGERIYDPRLGRFLSTDPFREFFPGQSPYVFASNNPILLVDHFGEAPKLPPLFSPFEFMKNIGLAHPLMLWGFNKAKNTSLSHLQKAAWFGPIISDFDSRFHSSRTNFYTIYGVAGEIEMISRFYREIAPNQFLSKPLQYFLKPENLEKDIQLAHHTLKIKFEPDALTDYTITYTPKPGSFGVTFNYTFDDIKKRSFLSDNLVAQSIVESFAGKTEFVHEVKIVSATNGDLLDIIEKGVDQLLNNPLVKNGGVPVLVIDRESAEKAVKVDVDRFSAAIQKLRNLRGGLASENGLNKAATKAVDATLQSIRTTTAAPPAGYYDSSDATEINNDKENR